MWYNIFVVMKMLSSSRAVKALVNAKINLSLSVTGITENGYHTVDSVMQSVSLNDTVSIKMNDCGKVTTVCDDIQSEANLCTKAARLFFEATGFKTGADIFVDKRIPQSAGLGGGSADAAAVLLMLNHYFSEPLDIIALSKLALSCGVDVPFFLTGGTAVATGLGEQISKINSKLKYALVLVKEGSKPSTAQMYKQLDGIEDIYKNPYDISVIKNAVEQGDYKGFTKNLCNTFSHLWNSQNIYDELISVGADAVCLSGSGPTVFGVFKNIKKAGVAAQVLSKKHKEVYAVTPADRSFILFE